MPGAKPPMLFFPGGHCSAAVDCGWSLYTSLGYGILSFSRPGYGSTSVGALSAQEFVPAVKDSCSALGVSSTSGAVGVSFGGLQAIHVAVAAPELVPRLALHSCAPSTHAYPDTRRESLLGPIVFAPAVQHAVWAAISRLVGSDAGLRAMVGALSNRPLGDWWPGWSTADRDRARRLFRSMGSDAGFVNDLRQGRASSGAYRRFVQSQVRCPTFVTASRSDAGVAFRHALDLVRTIPTATLVELDAPSHLFWIGPTRPQVERAVGTFLEAAV